MGGSGLWLRWTTLIAALAAPFAAGAGKPTVAFYYGRSLPVPELSHFGWVVVQPDHVEPAELEGLQRAGVRVFAYLSLGEAASDQVDPAWVLGSNPGWNSAIVNPAASGWRDRILERAAALRRNGYDGLFLDTLDSYLAVLPGSEARRAAASALAAIVRGIHEGNPDLRLVFNRGFEILDEVGNLAAGFAAESLLHGWDAAHKRYVDVGESDRDWLTGQLRKVKERFRIPVVVIDYLPPGRRAAAREAARKIAGMGFVPWISTPALDALGVGSVEVVPRRVLLLYDGAETPSLQQSPAHRLAALPLEHLGCVPEYLDVRKGLPREPLAGRYAGVVTWFTDDEMPDSLGYPQWLLRQIDAGVPLAMLGRPGFVPSRGFLARIGLEPLAVKPAAPLRVAARDAMVGFEAEPAPRGRGLVAWRAAGNDLSVHVRIEDARGEQIDPVVTGPWGGLALDPYLVDVGYQGHPRWIVDPFSFLQRALSLRPAPVPDLTTENGARLLLVVAVGDGFASPAGRSGALSGDRIRREVLDRLGVPTTVSIPARELQAGSARERERLRSVAASIYALPSVEPPDQVAEVSGGNPQADGEVSLAQLSPSGIPDGAGFRVYLPGWNESGAAEWWNAARFDPRAMAGLIQRASAPRRLKPIGLYYPFAVATRPAALQSVQGILTWARDEGARALWSGEYAHRVRDFRTASVALTLDGVWQFRALGTLRTVRMPRSLGWPDLQQSSGVAVITEADDQRYVSFGPEGNPTIALAGERPGTPYLTWANAQLLRWSRSGPALALRLRGHEAVRFTVEDASESCVLDVGGRRLRPERAGAFATFSLAKVDTGDALLECGGI